MNAATLERWRQLWRKVSAPGDPSASYEELMSLYAAPQRHYHDVRHIAECLAELDRAGEQAGDPVAVELAIWFHDAIYDTHAPDNEERSAELARRRITEAGGDERLAASVGSLILATKTHDSSPHPDAPLLVDIDLSILGQPEARFWEYEDQIRREYDWVPATIFAAKRTEILRRFLDRERIYATAPFFDRYEQRARTNLRASLLKLNS